MTTDTPKWIPDTHSTVPQPAGSLCADWYRAFVPDAETILYALAHTKGAADRLERELAASRAECARLREAAELVDRAWTGDGVDMSVAVDAILLALQVTQP